MPLYLLAFAILILGAIVGGIAASNQGKRRRDRRRLEAELARVRAELDRIKRDAALREMRGAPSPQGLASASSGGEIAGKLNSGAARAFIPFTPHRRRRERSAAPDHLPSRVGIRQLAG